MISINSIYTAVQSIINKDHRGFLKPEDFNNFAKVAFYNNLEKIKDDHSSLRNSNIKGKSNMEDSEYLEEAMNTFFKSTTVSPVSGAYPKPSDFDYLEGLYYGDIEITKANISDIKLMETISNMSPSDSTPVYLEIEDAYEIISDTIDGDVDMYYYREPKAPKWTYISVGGDVLYDGSNPNKQDVELPIGYFHQIVMDILYYAGINIRDVQALDVLLKSKQVDDLTDYRKNTQNQ